MNKKQLLYLLMIIFSSQMTAQTCRELYLQANSYFKSGNYNEAKKYYQKVVACGDKMYILDAEARINTINEITYRANKTAPFGLSKNEVIIPYQGGDAVVTVNGGSSWKVSIKYPLLSSKTVGSTTNMSSIPVSVNLNFPIINPPLLG